VTQDSVIGWILIAGTVDGELANIIINLVEQRLRPKSCLWKTPTCAIGSGTLCEEQSEASIQDDKSRSRLNLQTVLADLKEVDADQRVSASPAQAIGLGLSDKDAVSASRGASQGNEGISKQQSKTLPRRRRKASSK
jgi:hypothetical protein